MDKLKRKRVAILATDGFEESELRDPMNALKENDVDVEIVSLDTDNIKAWDSGNWSDEYEVDKKVTDVSSSEYDALVLPGGVINPDKLRRDKNAVKLVRSFFEEHKPVAAICHGPWMLVEADVVSGRKVTSFSSIKTDLVNAGARWEDSEVVVDQGLVTSRTPDDMDAFIEKLLEEVKEGKHRKQTV